MKKILSACILAVLLLCHGDVMAQTVGTDISAEDITDFYYTYSWVGFNAEYLRYRFYVEDGKYFFFYETRGTEDDYGWNTEDDILSNGTKELSEEEWADFFALLKDGTVKDRTENLDDGDSGPWMYLYWKGDEGTNQEYTFASYATESAFVEFCGGLAEELAAEPLTTADLIFCEYSIYGGMENEDITYTVWRGDSWWDVRLRIKKDDRTEEYTLPWNTLDDLAEFMAGYHPETWETLPDAEEFALDAPSEQIVLSYEDGKQYAVGDGKDLSGPLFWELECFLLSYLTEGAETWEISYDSFDGGGPEFTPVLSAPEKVWIEQTSEYDEPHDEMATGSGFTVTMIFHGRIPGRTELTFQGYGPLTPMEEEPETVWVLEVDRHYNVKVVETREE